MNESKPGPESAPLATTQIAEVRYSLPEILAEIRLERSTGSFAMEKLDQAEIKKLFKAKRRAKSKA
jgi:hypothetical protein